MVLPKSWVFRRGFLVGGWKDFLSASAAPTSALNMQLTTAVTTPALRPTGTTPVSQRTDAPLTYGNPVTDPTRQQTQNSPSSTSQSAAQQGQSVDPARGLPVDTTASTGDGTVPDRGASGRFDGLKDPPPFRGVDVDIADSLQWCLVHHGIATNCGGYYCGLEPASKTDIKPTLVRFSGIDMARLSTETTPAELKPFEEDSRIIAVIRWLAHSCYRCTKVYDAEWAKERDGQFRHVRAIAESYNMAQPELEKLDGVYSAVCITTRDHVQRLCRLFSRSLRECAKVPGAAYLAEYHAGQEYTFEGRPNECTRRSYTRLLSRTAKNNVEDVLAWIAHE
jgi:hypothetical protein